MSIRGMHKTDDTADTGVIVPQKLWDDIIGLLSDYEVGRFHGGFALLERLEQHFDGPNETEL